MNNNSDNNNNTNNNSNIIPNTNNNNYSSNVNNINNNKKNNSYINNQVQKKFTLPLNSIPYSLKKKKDLSKANNNIIKTIGTKPSLPNLPTYNYKSKGQNTNLLEKRKEKLNKPKKIENVNKAKEKVEVKNNKTNIKNIKNNLKEIKNKGISQYNVNQENNKKEAKKEENNNNDYEDEEEFGNDEDDENLQINKVVSIDVKSSFMNNNYAQSINPYYSNSNNSNNSNKSLSKERCFTESDDSCTKSNLFDPPSGRSQNSNKTFLTANSYKDNKTENNYPYTSRFQFANILNNPNNKINNNTFFFPKKNMALMGSFLSTGTNSYSQSGQRYDSSNSYESGQSPNDFNVSQRQFSTNNINFNNNYMMQLNPLKRYSNNFTREFVPNQLFSLNNSYVKSNLFSKNTETKEKQIINLEDIARGKEKRTTVMIRNVPIKYSIQVLEKELEYFYGKFDCLYLPFDNVNGGNKGYAFLNLVNPYHVLMFYEVFQGKSWSFYESKKICELNFANFQGIDEIKKHAKNYKGKQPTFYINTNNNTSIEVPKKYLHLILEKNPNLNYYENKMFNTIIINSFM